MNLSDREIEVLSAYATGRTKAEVGKLLFITEDTVKTHLTRIQRRLGAVCVTHAIVLAERAGALKVPDLPPPPKRSAGPHPRTYDHPLPPDLAERYPSTTWNEIEWFAVLHADDKLFASILRGIGRARRS